MTRAPRTTRASPAGTMLESFSPMGTGSMRDAIHSRTVSVAGGDHAAAETGRASIGISTAARRSVSRITGVARMRGWRVDVAFARPNHPAHHDAARLAAVESNERIVTIRLDRSVA